MREIDLQIPTDFEKPSIGVVCWQEGDGIASLILRVLRDLGCRATAVACDTKLPDGLDVLIAYGPLGPFVPLTRQLVNCPAERRPAFVLWLSEPLPNPDLPECLRYTFGVARSAAERLAYRVNASGVAQLDPSLRWLTTRAFRFRYYGDLFWMRRKGILSLLAVQSQLLANFLRRRGFSPIPVFLGHHPDWGADAGLERDIDVLWMGKPATKRRQRLLTNVREQLRERGVEILMIDGIEHPYVFGEERTKLLNRTKIVLNLLREKWDDNSMRFLLAAPNRAMIVTEPTLPYTPFVPGVHLVEAPIEKIADTICYYLSHEDERRQIAEQAFDLIASEPLSAKTAVSQILQELADTRRNGLTK